MTTATTSRPIKIERTTDPNVVLAHSQSDPEKSYLITVDRDFVVTCQCPGFSFRKECKHLPAAYEFLMKESIDNAIQEEPMSDNEWSATLPATNNDPFVAQVKLYAALAKAQGEVLPAVKDTGGQVAGNRNYKYADLDAIEKAIGAALKNNGLAIIQLPGLYKDGCQHLKNVILHKDGGSIEHEMSIPCKNDAQGAGSGLTYARRYALVGIMRVITEDDDGRGAMPSNDQRGYSNQQDSPAPRPAQSATREFTSAPPVSQGQLGGTPNLAQMMALCRNTQFPSTGMMGAFLAGSDVLCAPTEELVEAWFDRNPGAQGEQLLTEAGAWYESQPWAVDGMKIRARKWRESQQVAA